MDGPSNSNQKDQSFESIVFEFLTIPPIRLINGICFAVLGLIHSFLSRFDVTHTYRLIS